MTLKRIPAAQPLIDEEKIKAVGVVIRSGMPTQGLQVAALGEEFTAVLVPGTSTVTVNSGTSILYLELLAVGIGSDSEVVVPSFTFAMTANSVVLSGAAPVLADIDEDSFCLDPAYVEMTIAQRTVTIMSVRFYRYPAVMEGTGRIVRRRGLMVFEDATQAHGASLNGKHASSLSTLGAFSLHPTKDTISGGGGMVTTTDKELARRVRPSHNQGMEHRYADKSAGFNSRMTNVHVTIGRVQLKKIEAWTQARRESVALFDKSLHGVITLSLAHGIRHVYHQHTIRIPDLDHERLVRTLRRGWDIGSGVHYPIPNHHLPSLEGFAPSLGLPVTHKTAREVVSLSMHPTLSKADLERTARTMNTFAKVESQ